MFREKLLYLAKGASMCVFAGSLPRGIEPDVYSALIREVKRIGVLTILDTDGDPLRLAMRAEPDVVSPNELECEELVGHEFNDDHDRAQAAAEMTRLGAGEAIMTVQDGCYGQVLEEAGPVLYRVLVAEQEVRSRIGSGDAFLAGYVAARYSGRSPVDCMRYGVACGAQSTQHFGAGLLDVARWSACSARSWPSAWRSRPRSHRAWTRRTKSPAKLRRTALARPRSQCPSLLASRRRMVAAFVALSTLPPEAVPSGARNRLPLWK